MTIFAEKPMQTFRECRLHNLFYNMSVDSGSEESIYSLLVQRNLLFRKNCLHMSYLGVCTRLVFDKVTFYSTSTFWKVIL